MKKSVPFVRHYWQFSLAGAAAVAGLICQLAGLSAVSHSILGGAALVLCIPLIVGMMRDLREGTYGVDILAATAIITAVVMREYWAAIVIVLMLTGGEALEDYAENRARREMSTLLNNAPRIAHVLRGKREVDVVVRSVQLADKIAIRPGEVVPVDCTILEGHANVDESSLTGESVPISKNPGDTLLSGSVNTDGSLVAKTLRSAADSQYEQIVKLVRSAAASKAPFVRMADRFAIPFTIVSFAIAIGAWVLSGDSKRFLEVLVVATPCPLILAAPIAIISGMSRASKAGIIVKNGTALERLANAKSIAFDKTGTLTHGKLAVLNVKPMKGFSDADVLSAAASLEKSSNHIVAQAIVTKAEELKAVLVKPKHLIETAGQGLSASLQGKHVVVGRPDFLKAQNVDVPQTAANAAASSTSTMVGIDGALAGTIYFSDELREESTATVERLRSAGVKNIHLITGDAETTARSIAKSVGIKANNVVARALPIDKLKTVERELEAPVAFVGDGVNDAPVLVSADVGIALGAKGSTAASESADIVIMHDSLSKVADIRDIARRTFLIARQSILVGIGLSVILMFIFASGRFSAVAGAAVQELVDVVVIFNALRAHVAGHR